VANSLRTAWLVVVLLWPVALLNYLDRQMLAAMKTSVTTDIPSIASETDWGTLLAAFKWVYAAFSPIGGYIADRFSRRGIILGSLFIWSAVTWATGHCRTYDEMLLTRGLMGISEAFYIPAALALIADFHSGATRSRAVGVHQMAIYAGVMVGGFSGYAADAPSLGWRWAFSAAGTAGILYTLPLLWLLPAPPRAAREVSPDRRTSPLAVSLELMSNANFLLLVACFTLPALAGWVVKDWMPATLKEQLQISQGAAGVTATLAPNVAALLGAAFGGWLADRWMHRSIRGRTFVSALGIGLLIPALLAVSFAHSIPAAAAILAVFGFGWGLFDCNNMPILAQIVRPQLRATGYGIMNLISISCGGGADYGFGLLRDLRVPLPMIFGLFAAVALLSVLAMLRIRPRPELVRLESQGVEEWEAGSPPAAPAQR
jgi:MFS family permease